jgi:GTP-binding protein
MDARFVTSAFSEHQYPPPDVPDVAFAGKSNVGKSSLINALTQRKNLARTSGKPGRTQSINFYRIDDRLYLVDLPGYGYAKVPPGVKKSWRHMVETYLRTRSSLAATVVILDIRRDPSESDLDLLGWLEHYSILPILVLTKADKLSRQQVMQRSQTITKDLGSYASYSPAVFSARTGMGREAVWEKLENAIKL